MSRKGLRESESERERTKREDRRNFDEKWTATGTSDEEHLFLQLNPVGWRVSSQNAQRKRSTSSKKAAG